MEYIPNFIARKHGQEPVTYDLLILYESFALQRKAKSKNQKIEKISLKMDNYKNCVCVFLSKGNGDVLSQRNAGRCVKNR